MSHACCTENLYQKRESQRTEALHPNASCIVVIQISLADFCRLMVNASVTKDHNSHIKENLCCFFLHLVKYCMENEQFAIHSYTHQTNETLIMTIMTRLRYTSSSVQFIYTALINKISSQGPCIQQVISILHTFQSVLTFCLRKSRRLNQKV